MISAVIFDLDGIVVDTVPIHFKAWKKMFSEYGKEFNFDIYKKKVDGIPRMDGARAVLTDISDEELKKAAQKKQNYFREFLDSDKIPIYKSTEKLIKKLEKKGIPRAVISSSKNCTYILNKIDLTKHLDTIVDGNKITTGKPDPQIFNMASEEINAPNEKCVVFEDAVLGVEAAKNAGMFCIGIDRYKNPSRLKQADLIIKDVSEIKFNKLINII